MRQWDAKAMRRIAGDIVRSLHGDEEIADSRLNDFALAIVRQWLTYDGRALLYLPGQSYLLTLTEGPSGPLVRADRQLEWLATTFGVWKIHPYHLPDVIDQLNRGQSAEVVDDQGQTLRLWANPRLRTQGVERLGEPAPPPPFPVKKDYRKMAAVHLATVLNDRAADERAVLADVLAWQWQRYDGQACLFLNGDWQLVAMLTDKNDGGSSLTSTRVPTDVGRVLARIGIHPEVVPDVLHRFNIGQEVAYHTRAGEPGVLWYDIPERGLGSRTRDGIDWQSPTCCPNCSGILLWRANQPQQTCRTCGEIACREPGGPRPMFPLGTIEVESGAARILAQAGQEPARFLDRHVLGDWGTVNDRARDENNHQLRRGGAVQSVYHTSRGDTILVTSTGDRLRTVISYADPRVAEALVRLARRTLDPGQDDGSSGAS